MTIVTRRPLLRDYQVSAIEAVEKAEGGAQHYCLVSLPTGTGKTLVFCELIRRRGGRALVIAHRDELLAQAQTKLVAAGIGAGTIGWVKAGRDEVSSLLVLASMQTLARKSRRERVIAAQAEAGMFTTIVIDEATRREIADGLSRLLADTYTLYLKTHNYHWNVTGPMFQTLHLMFEQEYNELALAVDLVAERIRALGTPAPASFHEFATLTAIPEDDDLPDATEMMRRLLAGQETVVRTARSIFPLVERANDEPTADLLTQRMQVHEKTAWMLRSLLA